MSEGAWVRSNGMVWDENNQAWTDVWNGSIDPNWWLTWETWHYYYSEEPTQDGIFSISVNQSVPQVNLTCQKPSGTTGSYCRCRGCTSLVDVTYYNTLTYDRYCSWTVPYGACEYGLYLSSTTGSTLTNVKALERVDNPAQGWASKSIDISSVTGKVCLWLFYNGGISSVIYFKNVKLS